MVPIDGATFLNLLEYNTKLAIIITNMGNTDTVQANATREGGQNFVNRKIAINERKFPKTGKDAEQGCLGCPWYDIQAWREALNSILNKEG